MRSRRRRPRDGRGPEVRARVRALAGDGPCRASHLPLRKVIVRLDVENIWKNKFVKIHYARMFANKYTFCQCFERQLTSSTFSNADS